ncbi:MAG: hypothetical protein WDN31_12555 [Hyphomicrobium sp.]
MKISVDLTRLNEARFALRAAEIAARLARRQQPAIETEVSDGERELGAAAGDVRQADE